MRRSHIGIPTTGPPLAIAILAAACIALLAVVALPASAAGGPRVVLDPDTVRAGDPVTVHGIGFCGAEECSTISVLLDDEVMVEEVEVRRDGKFAVSIDTLAEPGGHEVVAVQEKGQDGEKVEVTAELTVAVGEQEPGEERPVPR